MGLKFHVSGALNWNMISFYFNLAVEWDVLLNSEKVIQTVSTYLLRQSWPAIGRLKVYRWACTPVLVRQFAYLLQQSRGEDCRGVIKTYNFSWTPCTRSIWDDLWRNKNSSKKSFSYKRARLLFRALYVLTRFWFPYTQIRLILSSPPFP